MSVFLPRWRPPVRALLEPAEEEFVDLDLALERLTLGGNHGAAQLVQHHPRGFVTADPQLALELLVEFPRWWVATK